MKKNVVRVCVATAILFLVGVVWDMNRRVPVNGQETQAVAEVSVPKPKVAGIADLSPRRLVAIRTGPLLDERHSKEAELDREYPMQESPEALRSWTMTQVRGGAVKAIGMQDQDGSAVGILFERSQDQNLGSLLSGLRFSLEGSDTLLEFSIELYDRDGDVVFSGPATFNLVNGQDGRWQLPASVLQPAKLVLADVVNLHGDQQLVIGGK